MTNTSISFLEKYLGLFLCFILTVVRRFFSIFRNRNKINASTKKIVFVKFIEQGALVLHQTAFKEAVARYGADNVFICTFLSNKSLIEIIDIIPTQNRIYINEDTLFTFSLDFFRTIFQIRKHKICTAIDLEFYSCATAIFCYLSGCAKRVGYHRYDGGQNYRGDLFTHKHTYSHYVHVAESSWYLLNSVEQPSSSFPTLYIDPIGKLVTEQTFVPSVQDFKNLNDLLDFDINTNKNVIVINPSLNDSLPLRMWPKENYKEIILGFKDKYPTYKIVLTGRDDEYQLTENFISSLSVSDGIYNLCGKTNFRDLLTLYSCAKMLLTSDSGPAHFSSLTPIDTLVLFGPETPDLYSPLSLKTKVFYKSLPCSPCYNVYNNRVSPCSNNVCMKKISVEEVFDYAVNLCN